MPYSILFLLLVPLFSKAHPGIGIVKDSRHNIYYTDLVHVWKVTPNGTKTIAVPQVHTHELYMDAEDNLYGQHSLYSGEATNRWSYYIWRLNPSGKLDTIVKPTDGFFIENYSFARDATGAMYWIQQGIQEKIIKTTPDQKNTVLATGDFKRVQWLLPVGNRLYFVKENSIYYLDSLHKLNLQADNISGQPNAHNSIFGLWADSQENLYVANVALHTVQQITKEGNIKTIYQSEADWYATGGLFDAQGILWVLEYNSKNEARVKKVSASKTTFDVPNKQMPISRIVLPAALLIFLVIGLLLLQKRNHRKHAV